jgi:hypothetical protein
MKKLNKIQSLYAYNLINLNADIFSFDDLTPESVLALQCMNKSINIDNLVNAFNSFIKNIKE